MFVKLVLLSLTWWAPADPLPNAGEDSLVAITSEYRVEVDYPNFVVALLATLGKIIGKVEEPERIFLEERPCDPSSPAAGYTLTLRTDEASTWLKLWSDTAHRGSSTSLPLEPRYPLFADATSFIVQLREFLADSNSTRMTGTFFYGDRYLVANAYRHKNLDHDGVWYFAVRTADRDNPEHRYLDAEVGVACLEERIVYPSVTAHLHTSDVTIRLSLERVTVR